MKTEKKGVLADVPETDIAGASWAIGVGVDNARFVGTPTNLTCTLESTTRSTDKPVRLDYRIELRNRLKDSVRVSLTVAKRLKVNVSIRFPEDQPGRSELDPNFFAPDNPADNPPSKARDTARGKYSEDFAKLANEIWNQSNVEFYVVATLVTGLTIGGFDADGNFLTRVDGKQQAAFTSLPTKNFAGAINVYLVKQIAEKNKGVLTKLAGVVLNNATDPGRMTMVLSDAGAGNDTGAHELGHSLTLDDISKPHEARGELNNFKNMLGEAGLKKLLMWFGADNTDTLITEVQSESARGSTNRFPATQQ